MAREMKDSGIAWIKEIPKDWEVVPFKSIYILGKGLNITKADLVETGVYVISYGQIHSKSNISTSIKDELLRFVPKKFLFEDKNALVHEGDVIFADTSEDLEGCGNCVYIDRNETIFAGYHTIIARNNASFHNNYFTYQFQTDCWRSQIRSVVNGVKLYSVPQKLLSSTNLIVPSESEQKSIANFLDKKCSEIDELISLQEKMIDELKAYKQSVITETITKGLNPNVELKDSGVDWIGYIPKHWKTPKLAFLTSKIGSGSTPRGGSEIYVKQGIKFLRSQNVLNERLDLEDVAYITEDIDAEMQGTRVQVNDILFNITGGSIGRCYYVDESLGRANVNQHVCIVRPNGIETKYLLYYLQSEKGQHQVRILQTGGNREGLSAAAFKEFLICEPYKEEQCQIAMFLDSKCSEIDTIISIKQKKIEELKEYKKSLIYEYITGKKQVI